MKLFISFYERPPYIFLFTIFSSLLLSYWLGIYHNVVNLDGICYLQSAQTLEHANLQTAMQVCPQAKWPFYSILIFLVTKFISLSTISAAFLVNTFFSAMTVCVFICLVKELQGNTRTLWFAVLTILLFHEFNNIRQYVVRDHGFFAFYLLSLLFYLRFVRFPYFYLAIAWSGSLVMATLFRIEGAVFLILMPFCIFFVRQIPLRKRFFSYLKLNLLLFLLSILLALLLFTNPEIIKASRLVEIHAQIFSAFNLMMNPFQAAKVTLSKHVFTSGFSQDATLVLSLVLISWYSVLLIKNLSWIYFLLIAYGLHQRFINSIAILGYIIINIMVSFVFLAEHFFLSKRYLVPLSLILLLWIPFVLNRLWEYKNQSEYKPYFSGSIIIILLCALGGIFEFGHSKFYLRQAGEWLANNVPKNAVIYSNQPQVRFYSKHFPDALDNSFIEQDQTNFVLNRQWRQYDYLALDLKKKNINKISTLLAEMDILPQLIFTNTRGDQVRIYKLPNN